MFTRTKVICTIGPSTCSSEMINKLYQAGMNVARLNMSHETHAGAKKIINIIKKINNEQDEKLGPLSILLDTQGPEVRTGDREIALDLQIGQTVSLTIRDEIDVETSSIKINYRGLIDSVKKVQKSQLTMA